jgi:hypothetical protein
VRLVRDSKTITADRQGIYILLFHSWYSRDYTSLMLDFPQLGSKCGPVAWIPLPVSAAQTILH